MLVSVPGYALPFPRTYIPVALAVHRYPFIHLAGERHCENKEHCPPSKKKKKKKTVIPARAQTRPLDPEFSIVILFPTV